MRRSQIPHDVFFSSAAGSEAVGSPADDEAVAEDIVEGKVEVTAPPLEPAASRVEKLQISVYIDPATARALDEMRFTLQYEHGHKASKSALVDYAIRSLSADMEMLVAAAEAGELDRG